jgi:hypothetical protein
MTKRHCRTYLPPPEPMLAHKSIVPGHVENPRVDTSDISDRIHSDGSRPERGESAVAKLHARPSNQYRYEHYDPFGFINL